MAANDATSSAGKGENNTPTLTTQEKDPSNFSSGDKVNELQVSKGFQNLLQCGMLTCISSC
jgi:hypothetical protein